MLKAGEVTTKICVKFNCKMAVVPDYSFDEIQAELECN